MMYFKALEVLVQPSIQGELNFDETLGENIKQSLEISKLQECHTEYGSTSIRWKFVRVSLQLLANISESMKCTHASINDLLSIDQRKHVSTSMEFIVCIAVLPNLIPGVGFSLKSRCSNAELLAFEDISIEERYRRLSYTIVAIAELCKYPVLNSIITSNHLNDLLAALLQLCHAPLKKPNDEIKTAFYNEVLSDRHQYQTLLTKLLTKTYQPLIIKELMILKGNSNPKPPPFLHRAVEQELVERICAPEGLKSLTRAIIETTKFDIGSQWRQIEVIAKIVSVKQKYINERVYYENISKQVIDMLNFGIRSNDLVFCTVAAGCIKRLYESSSTSEIEKTELVKEIMQPFLICINAKDLEVNTILLSSDNAEHCICCLYMCFVYNKMESLPSILLRDVIAMLYLLYQKTDRNIKIQELLLKYFTEINDLELNETLDCLIFYENGKSVKSVNKNLLFENAEDCIQIKFVTREIKHSINLSAEYLLRLLSTKNEEEILNKLFIYLLHKMNPNEYDINEITEKNIIVVKMLSQLAEKSSIQKYLIKYPKHIINFVSRLIENKIHSSVTNNDDILLMSFVMLTYVISSITISDDNIECITKLSKSVERLKKMKLSSDLSILVQEVYTKLTYLNSNCSNSDNQPESRCSEALRDVCDELLPVRAHGLLEIAKLIAERNEEIIAKKHYVLCVLQENLKHEDSYIYLSAIRALSSMAQICPEDIIEMLTIEFLSEGPKLTDGQDTRTELRMKIGEVLVCIMKSMGNEVVKYKSVLLNAFLSGAKDGDFLVRASSLSNLAELCRVLVYDLGAGVVVEIFNTVESIINTEKSPEVRRAATLICSQVLHGLKDGETKQQPGTGVQLLWSTLMPLLRSLRLAYESDSDEMVKLHAQVAIETLNDIVKEFLTNRVTT